jgi:hypothetical protein
MRPRTLGNGAGKVGGRVFNVEITRANAEVNGTYAKSIADLQNMLRLGGISKPSWTDDLGTHTLSISKGRATLDGNSSATTLEELRCLLRASNLAVRGGRLVHDAIPMKLRTYP